MKYDFYNRQGRKVFAKSAKFCNPLTNPGPRRIHFRC